MITPMKKVFVATRSSQRESLLTALRDLGVLHLTPVDPAAKAPAELVDALARIRRALQILANVTPAGDRPDLDVSAAVAETLELTRLIDENNSRLTALHREAAKLKWWGDLELGQLTALADAGVTVQFASVPTRELGEVHAELIHVVATMAGRRSLVAAACRSGDVELPESAELIEPPPRDRPTYLAEAQRIDEAIASDGRRLAALALLTDDLKADQLRLAGENEFAAVLAGGTDGHGLFAVQGWVPAEDAERMPANLSAGGVAAAVVASDPDEDDEPPTHIQYPRWASPIRGLFDILGAVCGYREFDVGATFMIALPIFAAMLIGDGGYGLLFLLGPLLAYRRCKAALGADFTRLMIVVGAATVLWGLLNATFFGVTLYEPIIPVDQTDASLTLVMRISFYMGAIHLTLAQLWAGVAFWPSLKALRKLGWAIFIWGMLGVVFYYVLRGDSPADFSTPWPYLLITGAALAIIFDSPSRNPLKMIGLGIANFPLSMLSSFSDVISYVRLMAVGLASGVLAVSFNDLALDTGHWYLAGPVMILGHGLNIALCMIAMFAHGVRLNMLEFSTNLGMQWSGHAYQPFARIESEEIRA